MIYLVTCAVAFLASALTFFSGFGLGTLLLPAFALFFPVALAVALTAVVHFLNGAFKLVLVWRHVEWGIVVRFGITAMIGALAGASTLLSIAEAEPLLVYALFGRETAITPAKLVVGILLLLFACAEGLPSFRRISFPRHYLPLGGFLSGYFGGLAGMQGALRSAFLVKAGLAKEAYIGTGSAVAFLIDVSRLAIYWQLIVRHHGQFDYSLLAAVVAAALAGATLGNRYLPKATMAGIQRLVAVLLLLVSLGLISGLL
jgi:uncharacterized membrane protein YfcA